MRKTILQTHQEESVGLDIDINIKYHQHSTIMLLFRAKEIDVEGEINLRSHTLRPSQLVRVPDLAGILLSLPLHTSISGSMRVSLKFWVSKTPDREVECHPPEALTFMEHTQMSLCMEELEICSEIVNSVQTAIYCEGLGAKGLLPCADLIQKQKLALF